MHPPVLAKAGNNQMKQSLAKFQPQKLQKKQQKKLQKLGIASIGN